MICCRYWLGKSKQARCSPNVQRQRLTTQRYVNHKQQSAREFSARVQVSKLNDGIKKFYDQSSGLWENMWGQHMHHGFYEPGKSAQVSRVEAQIVMIGKILDFAGVKRVQHMVDVGCGIGGSSRCVRSGLPA